MSATVQAKTKEEIETVAYVAGDDWSVLWTRGGFSQRQYVTVTRHIDGEPQDHTRIFVLQNDARKLFEGKVGQLMTEAIDAKLRG